MLTGGLRLILGLGDPICLMKAEEGEEEEEAVILGETTGEDGRLRVSLLVEKRFSRCRLLFSLDSILRVCYSFFHASRSHLPSLSTVKKRISFSHICHSKKKKTFSSSSV